MQKGGGKDMPRKKGSKFSGKSVRSGTSMRKTALNSTPYVAGGAMGAVIGAGVGVATAAVMQNKGVREKVSEVIGTVQTRIQEMPQSRQILGGRQQKAGMKLGRVTKRGRKKGSKNKEGM